MKQFATNPRIGWVKANELTGPEVVSELSRLSKENSELRKEIEKLILEARLEEESKYDKIISTLKNNMIPLKFHYQYGSKFESETKTSYYEIFKVIASELMIEKSVKSSAHYIGLTLNPHKSRSIRKDWPVPSNYINRIFADFNVLDLIEPSQKKHSVKDTNDYWTLTEDGKNVYKMIRQESLFISDS